MHSVDTVQAQRRPLGAGILSLSLEDAICRPSGGLQVNIHNFTVTCHNNACISMQNVIDGKSMSLFIQAVVLRNRTALRTVSGWSGNSSSAAALLAHRSARVSSA